MPRTFHRLCLMLSLIVVGPLATVTAGGPSSPAVSSRSSRTPPPSLPDDVRVTNGCHLSALRYVARFLEAHPRESASVIVIAPPDARGPRRAHSIVLLTWQGDWWGRDENFGVFPLRRGTRHPIAQPRLIALAEAAYVRHTRAVLGQKPRRPLPGSPELPLEQRLAEVRTAATIVPLPTQIFVAAGRDGEIPLLLFRPQPGWVGVYDPQHGTVLGESASFDGVGIIRYVVQHLGYRVDQIRAHPHLGKAIATTDADAPVPRRQNDPAGIEKPSNPQRASCVSEC